MRIPESPVVASQDIDALEAPSVDDSVTEEVSSQALRDAIDRNRSEVVGQSYHPRAPTWAQNVSEAQNADARRLGEDAARVERDRATVAWLLADDAARKQASTPNSDTAAMRPAADEATGTAWRRGVVIPLLLALMVSAVLTWLVRRPGRAKKARTRRPDEGGDSTTAGTRRRRRSRRHRVVDPELGSGG